MWSRSWQFGFVTAVAGVLCALGSGCGLLPSSDDASALAAAASDGSPGRGGSASELAQPDDSPQSVGDVSGEPADPADEGGKRPEGGALRVVIRNTSAVDVDVTARFVRGDLTVHLAFVQVLAGTVSVVASSVAADSVELHTVTQDNVALAPVTFLYGIDFDEQSPAVLLIDPSKVDSGEGDRAGEEPSEDSDDESEIPPGSVKPPSIDLLEPAGDRRVALGSTFLARWADESESAGAEVVLWMRPVGGKDTDRVRVTPALDERWDGINDQWEVLVQSLDVGLYEVVAEVSIGRIVSSSVAPGLVDVYADPDYHAPTVTLRSPMAPVRVFNGGAIDLSWEDFDPDSSAVITISLVAGNAASQRVSYRISPPISEDPDGPVYDSARLAVSGVLPGIYDLVATIDDGRLMGTSRIPNIVEVLALSGNDPPTITLESPARFVAIERGGVLQLAWTDRDDNDDAVIAIVLDSDADGGRMNGNELLLVSGISEDPDGAGADEINVVIPDWTPTGDYRVVAIISDGSAQDVSVAPGVVRVVPSHNAPPPSPRIEIAEPVPTFHLRHGDFFSFEVIITDATEYLIRVALVNDRTRLDATRATRRQTVDARTESLTVDTALLALPNSLGVRWFDLEVSLYVQGRRVSFDAVPISVWIRQEVQIVESHLIEIDCDGNGSLRDPQVDPGLFFTWYGGGFASGDEVAAPLEFWLAKDGVWPPNSPLGALQHLRIFSTVESPANARNVFVPWLDFADLEAGQYTLLAVVRHPVYGNILHIPQLDPIEVCPPDGINGRHVSQP